MASLLSSSSFIAANKLCSTFTAKQTAVAAYAAPLAFKKSFTGTAIASPAAGSRKTRAMAQIR